VTKLTGSFNRRASCGRWTTSSPDRHRSKTPFSVALIDLD